MTAPSLNDIKPYIPAKDFERSLAYYRALGAAVNWQNETMAELDFGPSRVILQDYFVKKWAWNSMLLIPVDDAAGWHTHIADLSKSGEFGTLRVDPPRSEEWCTLVTHAWDPSGVLLMFAQFS